MLVLEQLLDHVERLPARRRQEVAAHRGARQQVLALMLRQRLREPLGQQDLCGDGFGAPVPRAERRRVTLRETRDVGDGFLEIAPEHQRGAVAVSLAEFVAGRDVGDPIVEAEVPEPRRLADVEMIDRMQVVVEAGLRDFLGRQAAAIGQPPLHHEDVEPGFGEIGSEDQAVMAGADDDAVIAPFQRHRHVVLLPARR